MNACASFGSGRAADTHFNTELSTIQLGQVWGGGFDYPQSADFLALQADYACRA